MYSLAAASDQQRRPSPAADRIEVCQEFLSTAAHFIRNYKQASARAQHLEGWARSAIATLELQGRELAEARELLHSAVLDAAAQSQALRCRVEAAERVVTWRDADLLEAHNDEAELAAAVARQMLHGCGR